MKVYVVSSGEYSDFGIEQIFSSKEKAQQFIDISKEYGTGSFNEIDEYELDPELKVPLTSKFKYFWWFRLHQNGDIQELNKNSMDILQPEHNREYVNWTKRFDNNESVVLCGIVNANDKEHAQKIIGDIRTKLLRENRWISIEDYEKKQIYNVEL